MSPRNLASRWTPLVTVLVAPLALAEGAAGSGDEVIVSATRVPDATSGALGIATALREVPQAVTVLPADLIELQQPLSLTDILRNAPGVSNFRNSSETFRTLSLRGFVQNETTTDGLRNTDSLNIQPDGLASLEAVEVIRGPAAALYGRGSLGGAVNLVTRKPRDEFGARLSLEGGDPSSLGGVIDVTGPLAGGWSARFIGAYEDRDSFIDFTPIESWQLAPSLRWADEDTSLLLQADYREREQIRYIGLPQYGTVTGLQDLELPIGANYGEPSLPPTRNTGLQFTASFEQALSDEWSLRVAARRTDNTYDQQAVALRALAANNRTLNRSWNRFDEAQDENAVFAMSDHVFVGGAWKHRVRVGVEYAQFSYDSKFYSGRMAAIDIANPVYGAQPTGVFLLDDTTDEIQAASLYLQDHVALGDSLTVLVGGRWDRIDTERRSNLTPDAGRRKISAFTPRLGMTYQLSPRITAYATWGENIEAQNNGGSNATLTPFRPVEGRQYEAGLKFLADERVSAALAVYRINATGVLTTDPNDPNGFSIPTGERRSQGLELEMNWQPNERLTLLGQAAYTHAEIIADNDYARGTEIQNVPRRSARLFAAYQLSGAEVGEGWSMNAAVTYLGDQAGNLSHTFIVPDSTLVDAGVGYQHGAWRLDLQLRNLLDERHFIRGAFDGRNIVPGDPRTVIARVRYTLGSETGR